MSGVSVYAEGHASHQRQGAESQFIEVCWRCAEDWLAYCEQHPEEAPPPGYAVVLAVRPSYQACEEKGGSNDPVPRQA
jgi:hypothetical protein